MPSDLDRQLIAIMDGLTAPGAPFETAPCTRGGVDYLAFKGAPPSLAALFAHFCAQHGDAEFLVDGDVRLSFSQTYALAHRVAQGLVAGHGVQRGERIGIAARNSANWILLFMGVVMAGGCATLLNGWWTAEELESGIELAGCRLVLADPARAKLLAGHEGGAEVATLDHGAPETGLAALLAAGPAQLPALGPDDLATILFTSGSTGTSKGASSDHQGVVHGAMSYGAQTLMALIQLTQAGTPPEGQPSMLINVPLFHVTALVPVFLQSFVIGRKLVVMAKWDALEALRLMDKERLTYFVGVPLMSFEIATHPRRAEFDLTACKNFVAGGAPRPVDHLARLREAFPWGFPLIGYGLTETNGVGCGNYNENYLAKPDSTGTINRPITELAIFGNDGASLPQGQTGEVAFRTIANFLGYWNNAEATAAAIRSDGFFLTGDLGYLDEDGYLFIVDRKKDIIIRGGENISCLEVEQAIYAHPGVAECSVFGLPDARFGEVPGAVWLMKPGHELEADGLRTFLVARIAAFKVPVHLWQSFEPLPRLGTEKIDRRALRGHYAELVG